MEHLLLELADDIGPARGHALRRLLAHVGSAGAWGALPGGGGDARWLHGYNRLTIVGRQNLPADRSFILVANHASHLDTLCLLSALPVRQVHRTFPVAAAEYFCVNPVLSFLAKLIVNVLPFDRQFACWHSLGVCSQLLEEKPGTILILFPEGTRTDASSLATSSRASRSWRRPATFPSCRATWPARVPPCRKAAWFPRAKAVRLTIGAPHLYAHLSATKESRTQICRELRAAVMSLGHFEPAA